MNMHLFIFFELKYIKLLTVLNYQGRYGQTLLFLGKTVKGVYMVSIEKRPRIDFTLSFRFL